MKMKFLNLLILISVFSLPITVPTVSFSQKTKNQTNSAAAAPKFALLVGINEYQNEDWKNLGGTHNDVEMMKGLLSEYGFAEKKARASSTTGAPCGTQTADSPLKTLCSGQATRQAILDAFDQHLIENAKNYQEKNDLAPEKGATLVFYYSGHGAYLADDNGDESDGFDETLVPADADLKGTNHIRDDEFNKRLQILRQYTTNITFIIDSCHSGTVTRGGGEKSVSVINSDGTRGGENAVLSDGMDSKDFYVTVSGSLPNERAREVILTDSKTKKEKRGGAMTYYFVNLLRQNPGVTYRELMNLVRNAVANLGAIQTPQAEGDIDRIVFGQERAAEKKYIFPECIKVKGRMQCSEIVKQAEGNDFEIHKIKMKGGKIVGARSGGAIVLYGQQARDLSGDENLIGSGIITSADEFTSEAEVVLTGGQFKTVPENAKILLVAPYFTDEKRKVAIDFSPALVARSSAGDEGVKNMNRLTEQLENNSYLEPVRAENLLQTLDEESSAKGPKAKDWDIAVVRATFKDFKFGNPQPETKGGETPADTEEVYFLANRSGMPLYNFRIKADDPHAAEAIKEALERHVRLENLRNLGNEASGLNDKIKIEFIRIKDFRVISRDPLKCETTPVDEKQVIADQTRIPHLRQSQMTDGIPQDNRYFFRITNSSAKDLYIYIYSLGTDGKIEQIYPPKGAAELLAKGSTFRNYGENRCQINFVLPETYPGKETVKFIFSSEPFPGELLESPEIGKGQRDGGKTPLERLLRRTATNTRGTGVLNLTVGNWTAINFDLEVVP